MYRIYPLRYRLLTYRNFPVRLSSLKPRTLSSPRNHNHDGCHGPGEPSKGLIDHLPSVLIALTVLGPIVAFGYLYLKPPVLILKVVDGSRFVPYTVVSKVDVSPNAAICTLRPSILMSPRVRGVFPYILYSSFAERGIWSVECKHPLLDISHFHMPLPPTAHLWADLRFWVSKDHRENSLALSDSLQVGDVINLRGHRMEYEISEWVESVVFLASENGIVPALQVINTLMERRGEPKPRIKILWAIKSRKDCNGQGSMVRKWRRFAQPLIDRYADAMAQNFLFRELLHVQEKYEGLVMVDCLVDEELSNVGKKILRATGEQRVRIRGNQGRGKKLLFVSGEERFMTFVAGSKQREGGNLVQSRPEGVIGNLGLEGWTVVKL